ncbi:hypothetical protein GIB67_002148 [Kingdonia uniflora]|uniref:Fructose-1-6-bisphosphatase class 1 C-terminal domain-containing protein n=1 Tax=Kingdonia uniflora TaxID=39325 RepID=A0A7J7KWM8_9MAGN|nr:hypothetical protein GIB67_002148 [Kingdonia uniflora]
MSRSSGYEYDRCTSCIVEEAGGTQGPTLEESEYPLNRSILFGVLKSYSFLVRGPSVNVDWVHVMYLLLLRFEPSLISFNPSFNTPSPSSQSDAHHWKMKIIVKEKWVFTSVISPSTKAKLILLFEVAPLGLLVEIAEGYSSDGYKTVLNKVTTALDTSPVAVSDKLESRALRCGLKVLVMPSGNIAIVHSLKRGSQPCTIARAGDNVVVGLQGIVVSNVVAGGVLCYPSFPVAVSTHLELKILPIDLRIPILIGS